MVTKVLDGPEVVQEVLPELIQVLKEYGFIKIPEEEIHRNFRISHLEGIKDKF